MVYRWLAYLVVALHLLIAVFALGGAMLVLVSPWVALVHVPLAIWVSAAHWMGWTCPLTPLENYLRRAGGERGYSGGFLDRYVFPALDTHNVDREARRRARSIGLATAIINVVAYIAVGISYANEPRLQAPPHSGFSGPNWTTRGALETISVAAGNVTGRRANEN